MFKSLVWLHLDYGNIVYDRVFTDSFHNNLETIQYNTSLAITGLLRGTSPDKYFWELGLEYLNSRWCL